MLSNSQGGSGMMELDGSLLHGHGRTWRPPLLRCGFVLGRRARCEPEKRTTVARSLVEVSAAESPWNGGRGRV